MKENFGILTSQRLYEEFNPFIRALQTLQRFRHSSEYDGSLVTSYKIYFPSAKNNTSVLPCLLSDFFITCIFSLNFYILVLQYLSLQLVFFWRTLYLSCVLSFSNYSCSCWKSLYSFALWAQFTM